MDPELKKQAAVRWDELVKGGMAPEAATADVNAWVASQAGQPDATAVQTPIEDGNRPPGVLRQPTPGATSAFFRGALGAATFEMGDEVLAGLKSLRAILPGGQTPGEAFTESIGPIRERNELAREGHPALTGIGSLAGAVGTTLLGGAALGIGKTGVKMGATRLAAIGAAEGAATGFGAGEGNVIDRAPGTAIGAGVGAGAGVVVPKVIRGLGAVGGHALDVAAVRPSAASTGIPARVGRQLFDTVEDRADIRLGKVLPEGQALTDAIEDIEGSTRPRSFMDVNDEVRGVARATVTAGGAAKSELPDMLAARGVGQESRVLDDALRLSGVTDNANRFELKDDIIARREAGAAEAYGAIRGQAVDNPEIGRFLTRKAFKSAYNTARDIADNAGRSLPPLGELIDEETGELLQPLTIDVLDQIKRGLDDVLSVGKRGGPDSGGLGREGIRAIRRAKNEFIDLLDDAVDGYAEARSQFAGFSAMEEALEVGGELFTLESAEARRLLADMGDSEREMFVRGGLNALRKKIENTSKRFDLATRRPLDDITEDRRRLRLLFPTDEAFEEFQRGVADEARMAQTNRFVTGGSNTADKAMEVAELAGVDVAGLMSGNVMGMFARGAASAVGRRAAGFTGSLGEAMLPSFTATGADATRVMRRLATLRQGVAADLSRRDAALAGIFAVPLGGSIGRANRDSTEESANR